MSLQAPITSGLTARSRQAAALVTAALIGAVLAGCGGGDGASSTGSSEDAGGERQAGEIIDISGTDAVGENLAGSVAARVECRDWNGASEEQKLATIEDVRSQVSRDDGGIRSPRLTDDEAMTIFDNTCEPQFAQGFRLYKLYARAVAFAPLARAIEREQQGTPGD